jgi:hypothetical protein
MKAFTAAQHKSGSLAPNSSYNHLQNHNAVGREWEILSLIQSRQLLGKLTHHGADSNGTRPLYFLCMAYHLPYITLLINPTSTTDGGANLITQVSSLCNRFAINYLILSA